MNAPPGGLDEDADSNTPLPRTAGKFPIGLRVYPYLARTSLLLSHQRPRFCRRQFSPRVLAGCEMQFDRLIFGQVAQRRLVLQRLGVLGAQIRRQSLGIYGMEDGQALPTIEQVKL